MKLWDWMTGVKPIQPAKPATTEMFATMIRDRFSCYPSKNLTPDRLSSILEQANMGYCREAAELFEEFEEKDPHIYSVLQTRKLALLGLDWEIVPASESAFDKKVAKFVEEKLLKIPNFQGVMLDLLDAIGKGYAIQEILWKVENSEVVPSRLQWIHPKNVTWLNSIYPRILTETDQSLGIEPPPWKVIMHLYKAKSGHDTRNGVLRVISWMYLFKNYTIKDWVTFNEVFGMPIRVGKYDPGAEAADIDKLANAVKNMGADAAGVISKNTEIEFIESTRGSGRMNPYQMLIDFANKEISKAVLGQTLTSDASGQTGTYSTAKIHEMVRQDILEADADSLGNTITDQLIKPIVGFNFPNGWEIPLPRFWIKAEAEEDLKALSETYKNLAGINFPIPLSHIRETFGIPEAKDGEEVTGLPKPPAPAKPEPPKEPLPGDNPADGPPNPDDPNKPGTDEPGDPKEPKVPARDRVVFALADAHVKLAEIYSRGANQQKGLDVLLDNALAKNAEIMTKILAPLKGLIDNGGSLPEIRDGLAKLYPKMPRAELAELLYQVQMLAYMKGRLM